MRKLFDSIAGRLQAFVKQRDNVTLVVRCRDVDGITVLKILEGLDEAATSEMYWPYAGDFLDPQSFVAAVVKDFASKHEGVRVALGLQKLKPWPPIPAQVLDETIPAAKRLRELMIFSRSLLPQPNAGLVVWVLFPLKVLDAAGYARLMHELAQHKFPFPWFHHMRIILREDVAAPLLSEVLRDTPRVDTFAPDLSDQAMEDSLEAEAADTSLPLVDRVQAMFLSAQRDYSFGRLDEALKKHEVVLRYHASIDNGAMVALVLNNVGEIHQRAGRPEKASLCFENALAPACAGEHPPTQVLCNVVLNMANLRLEQTRYLEAAIYYDSAETLATVLRNPEVKLRSIDNLGYCQYAQGKTTEAVQNWQRGAKIADELKERELQRNFLARLRHHYASTNQMYEAREIEQQLAALDRVAAS